MITPPLHRAAGAVFALVAFSLHAPAATPSTPANVVAKPASDTEIVVTWDRSGTGETEMIVQRSANNGSSYQTLQTLPAGSNITTDSSCYPSTTYLYRVAAGNSSGQSAPSSSATAKTTASGANVSALAGSFSAASPDPYSITLTWTDPLSGFHTWLLERSADGVSYAVVAAISGGTSTALTYTDTPLSPNTTYHYLMRVTTGGGYGNYTNPPVSATTKTSPSGAPLPPANLTAEPVSASSTLLSWMDPNQGSASYLVETASFSYSGAPSFTQVGMTSTAATSFNLTTSAENFYYVRVRALKGGVYSGYTAPVTVRSPSLGTGSPKVYTIGPGKQYTSLGGLNWSTVGPGDTVEVYPNRDSNGKLIPYYEKPLFSTRGTSTAPINITGIPDPATGMLPIIDGSNAITASQWNTHSSELPPLSLVLIGTRADNNSRNGEPGYSPGYINFVNFEIRKGYSGNSPNTFKAADGSTQTYSTACGIYIEKGDHITIQGCWIHDNDEGVFGAGMDDSRNLESITLDSDYIYNNGTVGSYFDHNSYLEGINSLYQFNRYGLARANSYGGGGIKDRGAGTIIRYNWVEGDGHLLDLVETENYLGTLITLPSYHTTYVYGNVFYNNSAAISTTSFHYGGDQGVLPNNRKGLLVFTNNTLVVQADQSDAYHMTVFDTSSSADCVDARNNIIYFAPVLTQNAPELDLLPSYGIAYTGMNWVSPGWYASQNGGPTFTGHLAGSQNIVNNSSNNPGFLAPSTQKFLLQSSSQCAGAAGAIEAGVPAPAQPDLGALPVHPGSGSLYYLQWSSLFFNQAEQVNPLASAASLKRADGVANSLKYLFDLNPSLAMKAADWAFLPTPESLTPSGVPVTALHFRKNPGLPAGVLQLQTETTFGSGNWIDATPDYSATSGRDPATGDPLVDLGVNRSSSMLFLRLNADVH